ncbi:MAG TPA: hypothetical protein VFL53_19645 [Pseudolabrys sp.]|nr:hypothetical protein [Pseudolabrys sp.]
MINPLKAGVAIGALLGGYHLCWSLFVALGWAQPLIDFVFWMHFIQPGFVIRPFSLPAAAALIIFTFMAGFVIAFFFAVLWNRLHRHQGFE